MAVVSRDHDRNLIEVWTEKISPGSSIRGDAEATWCAICKAVAKGFNKIIIEGDAWNVIDPLQKSSLLPHWSIKTIVEDILNLAKSFVNINFSFVYREGNMSAHLLAKWATFLLWIGPCPSPPYRLELFRLWIEMDSGPALLTVIKNK